MNELIRAPENICHMQTIFAKKDGTVVGINKKRLYENSFFLNTNPPDNNVAIAAGKTSSAVAMRASGEGPMQLTAFGAVRDAEHAACLVRLTMRDGSGAIPMSNSPLHIDTVFGPGGQMYHLPEGLYVDEDRALTAMFTDLSGAPNHARITGVGAKYTQLQQDPALVRIKDRLKASQFLSMPYFYTLNNGFTDLTGLQSREIQIEIANQHNFEIHQIGFSSTGSFNLNVVDLTKGESIINAPSGANYGIPHLLMCGDTGYPYRFHAPILVFGSQRLLVTLQDTSGAANRIFLTLGGKLVKIRLWA